MKPKGTIFNRKKSPKHGQTTIALPLVTKIIYRAINSIGAGLIGFVIIGVLFTVGPLIKEEVRYQLKSLGINISLESKNNLIKKAEAEQILQVQKEAQDWGVNSYFSIVIPELDTASIVLANVDTSNEGQYLTALKKGVAHAKGTYFPGQGKNIYLFAHSAGSPLSIIQNNTAFFLLRKLKKGDGIHIYFADKKYVYIVENQQIVPANDTSWLDEGSGERLILQTCYPPGTTWKRLLIIATPLNVFEVDK